MLAQSPRSRSQSLKSASPTDLPASITSGSHSLPPLNATPSSTARPLDESHNHNHIMISTVTQQTNTATMSPLAPSVNGFEQSQPEIVDDDRSSSLSDLDEGTDEPAELPVTGRNQFPDSEVDSETETERLERTPQKLAVLASSLPPEKSPSKLAQQILVEGNEDDIDKANHILSAPMDHLSPGKLTKSKEADLGRDTESPSRKRKRSESAVSSLTEADEPLSKRSHSARYQADAIVSTTETIRDETTDIGQEPDLVVQDGEDTIIAEEERQALDLSELPVPAKGRKGRKGKRKGRRAVADADGETPAELVDDIHEVEQDVADAFNEEEEDSTRDEEVVKKRLAFDSLTEIERKFTSFREKHINQQLQQISQELELLKQPSSTHHEYQLQLRCIDEYRDEKIRYQDTLYKYKFGALQVKTVAEREQFQSQYFQEVREIRDRSIEDCYKNMYALQKDRRRWGADQTNYEHLYVPKRERQIAQQASYNLEVSILSGVAKHVGFPAAPDLPSLQDLEVESDLRHMKIPDRPLQPRILLRDAERSAAANNEFFEQNAWANPSVAHAILNAQSFATPHNNRIVSNGSTIDGNIPGSHGGSQNPTPQGLHVAEGGEGSAITKRSPRSSLAKAQAEANAMGVPVASIGFASGGLPSGLHGAEAARKSPAAMSAPVGISVGGGRGFGQ